MQIAISFVENKHKAYNLTEYCRSFIDNNKKHM